MNAAAPDSPAIRISPPEPPPRTREEWPRRKLIVLAVVVFAAHVGFIFLFGAKKAAVPRAVTNVPKLQLANDSDELLALNDPALFALPNPRDFASAVWLKMPEIKPPSFRWAEEPRWLPLAAGNLGAAFRQFMQTNYFADYQFNFKPQPKLSEPVFSIEPVIVQTSTLQITGSLAQRRLLDSPKLPSLAYNDVIAPSEVQALVDATGNVVSVVLLASSGFDDADKQALKLARAARFAPAPRLTIGRMIFKWHTVPMASTANEQIR